jgi:hypothetical protein
LTTPGLACWIARIVSSSEVAWLDGLDDGEAAAEGFAEADAAVDGELEGFALTA